MTESRRSRELREETGPQKQGGLWSGREGASAQHNYNPEIMQEVTPGVAENLQEAGKWVRTPRKGRTAQWQEASCLLTHRRKGPWHFPSPR